MLAREKKQRQSTRSVLSAQNAGHVCHIRMIVISTSRIAEAAPILAAVIQKLCYVQGRDEMFKKIDGGKVRDRE